MSSITRGNAAQDSLEFRQWLVGDIAGWVGGRADAVDLRRIGLRSDPDVEIKWGVHPAGEERPEGWAGRSGKRAISILIHGCFVITFRDPAGTGETVDYRLDKLGDYVMWQEDREHRWYAPEDALVLTVRWLARAND